MVITEEKMDKRCGVLLLILISLGAMGCQDKDTRAELEAMKAQAELEKMNKAVVMRWFNEVNKGNFETLYAEIFAPDCRHYIPPNSEPLSFEEYKPMARQIYVSFPEISHTMEDIVAEADKVVAKILVHTVHSGEFFGIPPTGKELEWTSIAIFQLAEGKIQARWEIADVNGILQQLGAGMNRD